MEKLIKQKKGITLIALVITIIVLLILAGIALASLTGENGVLNKAMQAREVHEKAAAEEQIKLKLDNPDSVLEEFLKDRFGEENVSKNEDNTFSVIQDGYEAIVDQDGNLIGEVQKVGPRPQIENIQITTDGTTVPEDYSLEEGTPVQINFSASMEGGTITSIEPQVPYTTNGTEMEVTFKVTGQVNGETYITNRTISLKSKYENLKGAKVNPPKLAQGMIPIKWNGSNWEVCKEDDPDWYRYVDQSPGKDGKSNWANVMLSDGTYKAGSVEEGTEVELNDLGSMFVWIPRYAYSITSLYHQSSTEGGDIQIAFLEGTKEYPIGTEVKGTYQGTEVSGKIKNESGQGNWNEHPAFTFGEDIVSGIWIAKFEASNNGNKIKVIPDTISWRSITVNDIFNRCREMQTSNASTYGINSDSNIIDTHMMKNSEWGAVAYLAQSSYGRNKHEVEIDTDNGSYVSNISQSTTGNITGIYNMSGSEWEYVAGYVNNGNSNLTKYGASLVSANAKYKDVYSKGSSDTNSSNYTANSSKYGDAIYETSTQGTEVNSWYDNNSYFPNTNESFFKRGGDSTLDVGNGMFSFYQCDGSSSIYAYLFASFRPVLIAF